MRILDSNNRRLLDIQRQYDRLCNQSRMAMDILQSPAMRFYLEHCQRMERLERYLPPRSEPELFTMPRYTPPKPPVVNVTFNVNYVSHEDVAAE